MIEKNKPMYSLENILNTLEKDGPSDEVLAFASQLTGLSEDTLYAMGKFHGKPSADEALIEEIGARMKEDGSLYEDYILPPVETVKRALDKSEPFNEARYAVIEECIREIDGM